MWYDTYVYVSYTTYIYIGKLCNLIGGGTHILRHTGTFRPFGSVFCKKFLDMGTTFHWKISIHGSIFSIKAPGHGWPI